MTKVRAVVIPVVVWILGMLLNDHFIRPHTGAIDFWITFVFGAIIVWWGMSRWLEASQNE